LSNTVRKIYSSHDFFLITVRVQQVITLTYQHSSSTKVFEFALSKTAQQQTSDLSPW